MSDSAAKFVEELSRSISADEFVKLSLSNYRGSEPHLQKVSVRTVETKRGRRLFFQYRYDTRDITKNFEAKDAVGEIKELLESGFRSGHLFTTSKDLQLKVGKRSSRVVTGRPTFSKALAATHDRQKRSLIDPGAFYLKALGIATDDGEIRAKQQDKWRQINKYVEILRDLFATSRLKEAKELTILDMGSGKGYLTFAAYDYFSNVRGIKVTMTGVESRAELTELCNEIARASDFTGLRFMAGDILSIDVEKVDVLIALHACDTATDDAIYKGVRAGAEIIVAAPCCHKEVRRQIEAPEFLKGVLKHGVMSERTAETVTDGLRALLLEESGYRTKVFEFVPSEHTPKNNMIAAVRAGSNGDRSAITKQIDGLLSAFSISHQRLHSLLKEN